MTPTVTSKPWRDIVENGLVNRYRSLIDFYEVFDGIAVYDGSFDCMLTLELEWC